MSSTQTSLSTQADTATLENNKRVAQCFLESLHDLSGATCASLMSETAIWQVMARSKTLPLGQPLTKTQFTAMMQAMRRVFPQGVRHEVRSMIAEGDRVAVESECYADFADGRHYNNLFHFLITVRNGQIELVREYTDLLYAKEVVFDPAS